MNSLGGECPGGNWRGVSVQGVNSWGVGSLKPTDQLVSDVLTCQTCRPFVSLPLGFDIPPCSFRHVQGGQRTFHSFWFAALSGGRFMDICIVVKFLQCLREERLHCLQQVIIYTIYIRGHSFYIHSLQTSNIFCFFYHFTIYH